MAFRKEVKIAVCLLFSLLIVIVLSNVVFSRELTGSTSFNLFIEGGRVCSNEQNQWVDGSQNPPAVTPTVGTVVGDCYDPNGVSPTGESITTCCPAGYNCSAGGVGFNTHTCVLDGKYYCSQLNASQAECESDSSAEANKSVADLLGGQCGSDYNNYWPVYEAGYEGDYEYIKGYCYNVTNCSCKWYPSSATNKCNVSRVNSISCTSTVTTPTPPIPGSCNTDIGAYEDLCLTEGFIHIEWISSGIGTFENDPTCQSGSRDVPCEGIVKMDFFNEYNFIITIISFIFIYSFIIFKRRKNKKEN